LARNSHVQPVNLAGIGIPIKTKEYVVNVQTLSLDALLAQLQRDVINVTVVISPIIFKMSACNISKIVRPHLRTTLMMESTSFALNAKLDFIKIFKMEIVTLAVFLSHVSAVLTQLTALPARLEKFLTRTKPLVSHQLKIAQVLLKNMKLIPQQEDLNALNALMDLFGQIEHADLANLLFLLAPVAHKESAMNVQE